jgi:UDP-N-acetylmuramoyl-tripeptide--D-alanyl-D-alanine ligase
MAKPDIAIVTSVGPAHLEMFKSISNIVTEKLSIANGLSENGSLIIPHEHLNRAKELTDKNILTVSLNEHDATSYAKSIEDNTVNAIINEKPVSFKLVDTASHKVTNALIILTLLDVLGFDINIEKSKVVSFKAPAGRGEQTILANNVTLFDESYNANPLSMRKAVESFKNLSKQKRIAILGDMLELGPDEIVMHKQIANYCDGFEVIYTVGKLMEHLHDELVNKSINNKHFPTHEDMLEFLNSQTFENCDIIVKGSKGAKVSTAVEHLKQL